MSRTWAVVNANGRVVETVIWDTEPSASNGGLDRRRGKIVEISRPVDERFETVDRDTGAITTDDEKRDRLARRAEREARMNDKSRADLIDDEMAPLIARIEQLEADIFELKNIAKG